MGNPNTVFGYSEQINVDLGEVKVGDGSYLRETAAVPAGKVWLLQSIAFENLYHTRGVLTISANVDYGQHILLREVNPSSNLHTWHGWLTLKAGDKVRITQYACMDGDTLRAGVIANEMVIPT